jgi:molybdopterin-binding protein
MKLSARNTLKGKVVDLAKGAVAAKVKIDVGGGNTLTSMILAESVEDLGIKVGDQVTAVIKATEVMVSK